MGEFHCKRTKFIVNVTTASYIQSSVLNHVKSLLTAAGSGSPSCQHTVTFGSEQLQPAEDFLYGRDADAELHNDHTANVLLEFI